MAYFYRYHFLIQVCSSCTSMKAKALAIILKIFSLMPLPLNHFFANVIATVLCAIPNRSLRITKKNVHLCFSELTPGDQKKLVNNSIHEMAKTVTELGIFWYGTKARVLALVKSVHGQDTFDQALSESKNNEIILVSPHIGAWELVGLHSSSSLKITIMYKPQENPQIDALITRGRSRFGGKLAAANIGGIKAATRALNQGEILGILPDQEPGGGEGVFAPFMGHQAYTMTLLTRLARKKRVPVIFIMMERLKFGRGYRAHYMRAPDELYSENDLEAVSTLNEMVKKCVDIAPSQYMWSYKRFKRRPDGTKMKY